MELLAGSWLTLLHMNVHTPGGSTFLCEIDVMDAILKL